MSNIDGALKAIIGLCTNLFFYIVLKQWNTLYDRVWRYFLIFFLSYYFINTFSMAFLSNYGIDPHLSLLSVGLWFEIEIMHDGLRDIFGNSYYYSKKPIYLLPAQNR